MNIIIVGPQHSCTRLFVGILNKHPDINITDHLSVPSENTYFKFSEFLIDVYDKFIIVSRESNCINYSNLESFPIEENISEKMCNFINDEVKKSILLNPKNEDKFIYVSYESLFQYKQSYIRYMLRLLGLDPDKYDYNLKDEPYQPMNNSQPTWFRINLNITDCNKKYFNIAKENTNTENTTSQNTTSQNTTTENTTTENTTTENTTTENTTSQNTTSQNTTTENTTTENTTSQNTHTENTTSQNTTTENTTSQNTTTENTTSQNTTTENTTSQNTTTENTTSQNTTTENTTSQNTTTENTTTENTTSQNTTTENTTTENTTSQKLKIILVGPGCYEIPPKGWGAVESVVWDYYSNLKNFFDVQIINTLDLENVISTCNEKNPDIVLIMYDEHISIAPKLNCKKIFLQTHFAYITHPDFENKYNSYFNLYFKKAIELQKYFTLNALSQEVANVYIKYGFNKDKINIIRNGAREDLFSFTNNPIYSDKSIYIAKIEFRKRQYVYQSIENIDFVGNYDSSPFDINNKNFLGEWNKETLYNNLSNYGNLVLLSDGEADPLVVKEALIAGLGVVVSDCAKANLDLDKPFINIIPNDKLDDIDYVKNVIEKNREVCKIERENIRKYGLEKFSWKNIINELIAIFHSQNI